MDASDSASANEASAAEVSTASTVPPRNSAATWTGMSASLTINARGISTARYRRASLGAARACA